MNKKNSETRGRNEAFVARLCTRIWSEHATAENSYITGACACYGYDLLELMEKCTFVDMLFLLFRGELPDSRQAELLEQLMIALINPGPRHPATRAAMYAGVGKTDTAHILPIALSVLGGSHIGGGSIESCIRFFRAQKKRDPSLVVLELMKAKTPPPEGDWVPVAGFGTLFGGIDEMSSLIAKRLAKLPGAGPAFAWGCLFANKLRPHGVGWLITGIASAVFADLGFQPRAGAGLFQIMSAPGLLAHGLEVANKPITAMPFLTDDNYIIEG